MKKRLIVTGATMFVAGAVFGGYLFGKSLPRSFLAVTDCGSSCYRASDIAGLVASVGIQRAPGLLPDVVKETDKCIALKHPFPDASYHFVIVPKKDIKNIGEVALDDQSYVIDCIALIRFLAAEYGLKDYHVLTNGPAAQDVTYLHFHLRASGSSAR